MVMETTWDLVIVGGGPAGLAAAQYGARANLKTVVLEELAVGGQSLLIDKLENYPGVSEPVSGYDFAERMRVQAENFGATVVSASVTAINKEGPRFRVECDAGSLSAGAVIFCTGAAHRHLGVPGEAEYAGRGVSYCATCDGPFFKGKPIVVVGGGDAACDEAGFLAMLSDKITMVHRREKLRAQPAVAVRVLENRSISMAWNSVVLEIRGDGDRVRSVILENVESKAIREVATDAVFVFIGSDPRTGLLPGAAKDENGYLVTDQRMETSIPGIFAAGDVRASPFRQVAVAVGEGAIAAHCAAQYIESANG